MERNSPIIAIIVLSIILIFGWCSSLFFVEGEGVFGYSYSTISMNERGLSPFADQSLIPHTHLLGTDKLGRDTLAGIGNGICIAFYLSLISIGLSLVIGIVMSILSTFHLFTRVKVSGVFYWLTAIAVWYLIFLVTSLATAGEIDFTYLTVMWGLISVGLYFASRKNNWSLSADDIVMKIIELWRTLPALLILLILASLFDNISYTTLGVLIALLIWPSYTRLLRGEFIRLSGVPFIKSAIASGASIWTLYWKHLLSNALTPLIAHICFAIVAIILLEATLSFLGIGIPYNQVSLGGMIKASTDNMSYWWLAVFPGLTLVVILISLNKIGTSFLIKKD